MWKKWGNQNAPSQSTIISYDDYYDDDRYLETIHEVESIRGQSRPQSVAQALPDLPFRAVPPLNTKEPLRHSHVSSLYSQPSPTLPRDHALDDDSADQGDVSPMSTPRSSTEHRASDASVVSPIEGPSDGSPRVFQRDPVAKSSLPRPIKTNLGGIPPSDLISPSTGRPKKQDTRWDVYSGEPTNAETGKPGTAKSGVQQPQEMQFPQLKERTKHILASLRDRDPTQNTPAVKQPPQPHRDVLENPVQRVPWRGASGREALVEPVKNTKEARKGPIAVPPRNAARPSPEQGNSRTTSPATDFGSRGGIHAATTHSPNRGSSPENVTTAPQQHSTQIPSLRMVPSQEDVKPVAPLKIKHANMRPSQEDPALHSQHTQFQNDAQTAQPLTSDQYQSSPSGVPAYPRSHQDDQDPATPIVTRVVHRKPSESDQHLGTSHLEHEPSSRFSWTTVATSVNESPKSMVPLQDSSPVPPIPPIHMPGAMSMRKRPVSTNQHYNNAQPYSNPEARYSNSSLVTRKPVGTDRVRSSSMMSAGSVSKSLPPTPIEMQAGDKLATLAAKLEGLGQRKRNNTRIRAELADSLKRNAITYGFKKRKEVENNIAELERERDEIMQEEHEIGVQLHRSQKKRDTEDCYESPTGLWIKRVTT